MGEGMHNPFFEQFYQEHWKAVVKTTSQCPQYNVTKMCLNCKEDRK